MAQVFKHNNINNISNINSINNRQYRNKYTNNLKFSPHYHQKCDLIKLPAGKRPPGYRFIDRLHEYAQPLSDEDAYNRLLASNKNGHHKYGLVVIDDSDDAETLDVYFKMAASSVFISEAFGFIEPETEVLVVTSNVYDMAIKNNIELDDFHIVADLRENHDLPADIVHEDFVIVSREDKSSIFNDAISEAVYIGYLPDAVATAVGKDMVQEKTISAYFHVLGAEERFDVPDGFDMLKAMSFGVECLDDGDLDWEERVDGLYAPLLSSDVIDPEVFDYDNPIFVEYKHKAQMIEDLDNIWCHYQENALFGVRIPSKSSDADKTPADAEELSKAVEYVGNVLGIKHAVEAWLDGVPACDVVG